MSSVNVLVAVDVGQALESGDLGDNVYMVDTTGYLGGGGGEGTHELTTSCNNGQTIVWSVVSIDPSEAVKITSFQGTATTNGMIAPASVPGTGGNVWSADVRQAGTSVQYTMSLTLGDGIEGKLMTFDPYITAINLPT